MLEAIHAEKSIRSYQHLDKQKGGREREKDFWMDIETNIERLTSKKVSAETEWS